MRRAERVRPTGPLRPGLLSGYAVAPVTDAARPLVRRVVGGAGGLRPAARQVVAWLVAEGLEPGRGDRVELAVHEVLANAFQHGHLADPSAPIDVQVVLVGSGAEVAVTDRALPGRWDVPPGGQPADARRSDPLPATRGRGLALAAAGVDGLEVRSAAGRTVVTLRLELP